MIINFQQLLIFKYKIEEQQYNFFLNVSSNIVHLKIKNK